MSAGDGGDLCDISGPPGTKMSLTSPKRSGCSREPVPMTSAETKPLAVGWTISEGRGHQGGAVVCFWGTRRHVIEGFDVPRGTPWHMIGASQVERSTCEPFAIASNCIDAIAGRIR